MGALDANGVYQYDGADIVPHAGLDVLLNYPGGSVSDVIAAINAQTTAWTGITLDTSRTVDPSHPPLAYRLEDGGDVLRLRGSRVTLSPGIAATAGTDYNLVSGMNSLDPVAHPAAERYITARVYGGAAPVAARVTLTAGGALTFRSSAALTVSAIEWSDEFVYLKAT